MNTASAVQCYALARMAAREDVELEDGTLVERDMGLGYARMDAPGLVGDVLGVSEQGAAARVGTAVSLASHPGLGEGPRRSVPVPRLPRLRPVLRPGPRDPLDRPGVLDGPFDASGLPVSANGRLVGRTEPANLACLCRRHHRTKQRRRWKVRLGQDGILVWTTPTGRVVQTLPVDHRSHAPVGQVGAACAGPDHAPGLSGTQSEGTGSQTAAGVTPRPPASPAVLTPPRADDPSEVFSWLEELLADQLALHEAAIAEAAQTRRRAAQAARRQARDTEPPPF